MKEESIKDGVYYLYDCLDGDIADKLLTLEDLKEYFRDKEEYTEKDAIRIAQDHEADLYRYTYKDGKEESKDLIYEAWACFG